MQTFLKDIRYSLRMLVKNRAFTFVAILALMLGIGANTAIFSVINAVILRPLPYEESDKLVFLNERSPQLEGMSISWPNYQDWKAQNQFFENIGVYNRESYNLTGSGDPERLLAGQVSADMFAALRAKPELGRVFTNDEDKPGAERVVVISYGLWQRRFGGNPGIVNQTISLNGNSYTVIGIMPKEYRFPSRVEIWVPVGPLSGQPTWQERGNHPGLYGVARLKPGVTLEQVRADMGNIAENLNKQFPNSNADSGIKVSPLVEVIVGDIGNALWVLLGAVGLVLLIACANVANLLLARATTRQKEIAIRIAMGASRWRIVRQLLTESVLLSVIGGGLGLLIAQWGVELILAISPGSIPRSQEIRLDTRVLLFTMLISVLTGIIFGMIPAWQSSRTDVHETLKEAARGSTGSRHWIRNTLVVTEVALTLVLLIGAGLLIRSFYRLNQVNPGFSYDNLSSFNISLPQAKYTKQQQRVNFYDGIMQKLHELPGVQYVGVSSGLPLGNNGWQSSFMVVGQPTPPPSEMPLLENSVVSPDYFRAMGIPLKAGRYFTDEDLSSPNPAAEKDEKLSEEMKAYSALKTVIIDEEFARRHWPDEDAIGKQIRMGGEDPRNPVLTVVGVVGRVKMEGLNAESNRVQAYIPFRQMPMGNMVVVVKSTMETSQLISAAQQQIHAVDPNQPIYDIRTMEKIRDDSIAPERFTLFLLGAFAFVAMLLAVVGIYGVMSYTVAQRTHEIGIRMALGARATDVIRLVVGHGMILALIGTGFGLIGAFAATRVMSSLLFGISATDVLTFLLVSLLLIIVALVACLLPARRAAKTDPLVALRYE
jgi:putative ABC transport system permease protein